MNISQQKRQRMLEFLQRLRKEHKDDDNVLIALGEIESELNAKKYGLVWEQHEEAVDVQMRTQIPVFTEDADREITAVPGGPYNFLLEGDNLHSLRLLEKTHRGRIDVIYIDPPYNTGNKDFVYNDTFIDGLDGFRHSKWLSFMATRLRIAKELMSTEGIIFISIDDNEYANLKLLCDEIFGEENFVSGIIIKSNPRGSQSKKAIASLHEYLLTYVKSVSDAHIIGHELTDEMASEYKYSDENGAYRLLGLRQRGGFWRASERPNLYYPFYVNPETEELSVTPATGYSIEVYPYQPSSGEKGTWRWSKEKASIETEKLIARSVKRGGETIFDIYQKDYLSAGTVERRTKARSIWDEKEMNYQNAATELKTIFSTSPFTYAKPTYLIKQALRMMDFNRQETVLDFFAGSGTTAQAVLELNAEDGGNRGFILCTNNEDEICEKITYPRIRSVITGKRIDGSQYSEGLPANLKYYRTDFVSKDEEYLSDALMEHIAEMIQLEHGVKLDGQRYIMVLDDDEADELAAHWDEYPNVKALYVSKNVLFTTKQNALFKDVEVHIIPDYYFNFELREVGETW